MKLALVMMINDRDLPFLKLHVPVFDRAFDGIVCIGDPADGNAAIDYMRSRHASVRCEEWRYDWGDWATKVFNEAETLGYDAALRLDGDEAIFPEAPYEMKRLLEYEASLLVLPRHEFFGDRYHVRQDMYPDWQARCWRLGRGIVVQGKKHEGVDLTAHGLSEHNPDPVAHVRRVRDPLLHIFHYGWASKTAIWRAMEKYQSQAQVALGQSPVVAFPPDQPLATHPTVPFAYPQPQPPDIVGAYAPFEE